jgi:hypothetical protein
MQAELFPVIKHRYDRTKEPERWGYIDRAGRIAIDYRFDHAGDFYDGIARVVLDGGPTYVDESGSPILKDRYDKIYSFGEGRGFVSRDKKAGYVDRNGDLVIELRYDDGLAFSEGLAAVRQGDKWRYIDSWGNERISLYFDEATSFSEGLAAVRIRERWAYLDPTGNLVNEPCFEFARSFSEGLAAVQMGGRFGYVDTSCSLRIQPEFDIAREFYEGLASVGIRRDQRSLHHRWHFIDGGGQKAFALEFYDPFGARFSEGLAAVDLGNGKCVYCDKTGATKIESAKFTSKDLKYVQRRWMNSGGAFRSGIARVMLEPSHNRGMPMQEFRWDDMAYIDDMGEVVWAPEFDLYGR